MSRIMYLKEAAAYLGKAPFTLQSWDRAGKLKAHRTANNRRFYYQSELDQYLGLDHNEPIDKRKIVAYARVSSNRQNDDFKDQVAFLRQCLHARGHIADEYLSDIGSGINKKSPKSHKLNKEIDANQIKEIYVTYEERFIPFGFKFLQEFCAWHACKTIVLNNEDTSPDK